MELIPFYQFWREIKTDISAARVQGNALDLRPKVFETALATRQGR
jgi:hypothetical protein